METFTKLNIDGTNFIAYNYTAKNGEIFITNKTSINKCRAEKNLWLVKKFENSIYSNN